MISEPKPIHAARNANALSTANLLPDLGHRTFRGGSFALFATFTRLGLQLVSLAILSRLLQPVDFGLIAMATAVAGFLTVFSDLGLSTATVQRENLDQDTVTALFYVNFGLGIVFMLLAWLIATPVATMLNEPRVVAFILALSPTIPINSISTQHSALLARAMRLPAVHGAALFADAVGIVVGITLAWLAEIGPWAIIGQLWTTAICRSALLWRLSEWRPTRVNNWKGARSAISFGAAAFGANLLGYLHRQLDNLIVGAIFGAGALGLYTRAYSLMMIPVTALTGPIGSALIPALSRLQSDAERFSTFLQISLLAICSAALPFAAFCALESQSIILIILGKEFIGAAPIFQALIISVAFQPLWIASHWVWIAYGRVAIMLRINAACTLFLLGAFALGAQYSVEAVSILYSISFGLVAIIYLATTLRAHNLSPIATLLPLTLPLLSSLASMLAVFEVKRWVEMTSASHSASRMLSLAGVAAGVYVATYCLALLLSPRLRLTLVDRVSSPLSNFFRKGGALQ